MKYVCNNALMYRSSHPVIYPWLMKPEYTHAIECKNLTFKMELVSFAQGGNALICPGYKGKGFLSLWGIQIYWNRREFLHKTTVQLP